MNIKKFFKSNAFFLIYFCTALFYTRQTGISHDHSSYLLQWEIIVDGGNPWTQMQYTWQQNNYGLVHNLFYFLYNFKLTLPKYFFSISFLIVNFMLFILLKNYSTLFYFIFFILCNFLTITVVFKYGLNDALVAALIGLAIITKFQNRPSLSGIILGVASLIKFYPLVLVFLFSLKRKSLDLTLFLSGYLIFIFGLILSYILWGVNSLIPFEIANTRQPKLFSILASIESNNFDKYFPKFFEFVKNNNLLIMILIFLFFYVMVNLLDLNWIQSSAILFPIFLVNFNSGSQQYYLTFLIILVGLLIDGEEKSTFIFKSYIPFIIFLSAFQFGYAYLTDRYTTEFYFVRSNVGFFVFSYINFISFYVLFKLRRFITLKK